MRIMTITGLLAVTLSTGCAATIPGATAAPPPFECTSIHPEVCQLEKQFHLLRFEQAVQNASIDEAERKRRATRESATKESAATNRG